MRWVGLLLLLASPAVADPALISFEIAHETIQATGEDIEKAEATFDPGGGPAVSILLHSSLDARFFKVSQSNVGKIITLRICGDVIVEPVLMGPLSKAEFIVTTATEEEARRLAELLTTKTCPDQPLG